MSLPNGQPAMNTLIIATTTLQLQVDRQRTRRGCRQRPWWVLLSGHGSDGAQQPWQAEAFVSRGGFGASPPSPPVRSWGPTRAAKAVPLKAHCAWRRRRACQHEFDGYRSRANDWRGGGDSEASVDEKEEQQWQAIYKALETTSKRRVEWSGMEWRRHVSTPVYMRAYA